MVKRRFPLAIFFAIELLAFITGLISLISPSWQYAYLEEGRTEHHHGLWLDCKRDYSNDYGRTKEYYESLYRLADQGSPFDKFSLPQFMCVYKFDYYIDPEDLYEHNYDENKLQDDANQHQWLAWKSIALAAFVLSIIASGVSLLTGICAFCHKTLTCFSTILVLIAVPNFRRFDNSTLSSNAGNFNPSFASEPIGNVINNNLNNMQLQSHGQSERRPATSMSMRKPLSHEKSLDNTCNRTFSSSNSNLNVSFKDTNARVAFDNVSTNFSDTTYEYVPVQNRPRKKLPKITDITSRDGDGANDRTTLTSFDNDNSDDVYSTIYCQEANAIGTNFASPENEYLKPNTILLNTIPVGTSFGVIESLANVKKEVESKSIRNTNFGVLAPPVPAKPNFELIQPPLLPQKPVISFSQAKISLIDDAGTGATVPTKSILKTRTQSMVETQTSNSSLDHAGNVSEGGKGPKKLFVPNKQRPGESTSPKQARFYRKKSNSRIQRPIPNLTSNTNTSAKNTILDPDNECDRSTGSIAFLENESMSLNDFNTSKKKEIVSSETVV
uniref:Clc-like protein n=1 Tax=Rhabditophanes sp. KR3021 TaxID=114890 RepID=A0AC35U5F5_9BILA